MTHLLDRRHSGSAAHPASRRGVMLVLVAALIAILLTMTVFSVDVAYMQLVRTQLRVATDAAAKAGVEALTRTGDTNAAVAAAIAAAGRNNVAGSPLVITADDIKLGRGEADNQGNWNFVEGGTPYTAVKIDVTMNSGSAAGDVDLMFAKAIGTGKYTPHETSTAAHLDQEIVLCIDRSHSMCFDESGVSWQYPPGHGTDPHEVCFPPQPTGSRWAALEDAVALFLTTVQARDITPRVACVTWGSTISADTPEYNYTGRTEQPVTTDVDLGNDFAAINTAIANRGNDVMLGGTNMAAGMQRAIQILDGPGIKPLANKTMILMTDGQWNQGADPVTFANQAANKGIVVHTVTFIPGADQATMAQIAGITGGMHIHAENGAELLAAFQELALTLPVVLTD